MNGVARFSLRTAAFLIAGGAFVAGCDTDTDTSQAPAQLEYKVSGPHAIREVPSFPMVLDGVIASDEQRRALNVDDVVSARWVSGEAARAKYGPIGANGVLEVTTLK